MDTTKRESELLLLPSLFTRASAVAAVVCAAAVAAVPASARMYLTTSKTVDTAGKVFGYVDGYAYVDGQANDHTFKLDVVRNGATVATAQDVAYAGISAFMPEAGDQITLTDVTTGEAHTTAYTGNPTLASSVCGAPSAFSGTRDGGATVYVSAYLYYGQYDARNDYLSLPGSIAGPAGSFSGTFGRALSPEWDISVSQGQALTPGFTAFSDLTRPVGTCPPAKPLPQVVVPGPPSAPRPGTPTPAKDVLPPRGTLPPQAAVFKPGAAYKALLAGRFVTSVATTEAGTVEQTLYLDDGAPLPKATAAAKKKKAKKPTVLGTGRAAVAKPGTVRVTVKLSKKGTGQLKRRKTVKLALVTVIKDKAGNPRVLSPKKFTVKRTKATK